MQPKTNTLGEMFLLGSLPAMAAMGFFQAPSVSGYLVAGWVGLLLPSAIAFLATILLETIWSHRDPNGSRSVFFYRAMTVVTGVGLAGVLAYFLRTQPEERLSGWLIATVVVATVVAALMFITFGVVVMRVRDHAARDAPYEDSSSQS